MNNLILIRGPIGSGKSSTIELLRTKLYENSFIDFDGIKKMYDNKHSSSWRREEAMIVATLLCERMMSLHRTNIIADFHGNQIDFFRKYSQLAKTNGYKLYSFLLYPPLQTCQARNREREVIDIEYTIDAEMVERYYKETVFIPAELQFDTSRLSPEEIVDEIIRSISS